MLECVRSVHCELLLSVCIAVTHTSSDSIVTRPSDVVLTYVLTAPIQTRFLQFVQCAQYC
jgi:hypothetical protein